MAAVQNTGNPRSIVVLHYTLIAAVFVGAVMALGNAVFSPDVPIRAAALVFGMGFLFGAYKLWEYRARR